MGLHTRYKNAPKYIMILLILGLVGLFGDQLYNSTQADGIRPPRNRNNLVNYVLPNASLLISSDTNTSIAGEFTVNGTYYEFSADFHTLSFIEISNEPTGRCGFTVADHNESDPVFVLEFLNENGTVYSTKMTPGNPANITVVHMLMRSALAPHFVELSAKLGGAGYIGPRGQHIQDLHRFALWVYRYQLMWMNRDEVSDYGNWDDLTVEFEKVNAIVSASANAGFWVESTDDLMRYTSDQHSFGEGSGRRLLGDCGSPTMECGNACLGMCGVDCWCWSWICGDCECWEGCRQHDHFCSCEGVLDYCCIDTFWISCDGNSTDSICPGNIEWN